MTEAGVRDGAAAVGRVDDPVVVDRLLRLFAYLSAVRAIFDRPVRVLTSSGEYRAWEAELAPIPGARVGPAVGVAADDAWLVLPRQRPTAPPRLPYGIDPGGVRGPMDDPATPPVLRWAATADPDVAEAFEDWLEGAWRPWALVAGGQRRYRELWDLALRLGQDEASLELVWGHGVVGWAVGGTRLLHPLMVTPVTIEPDPERGEVRVRPTGTTALETGFLEGLGLSGLEILADQRDRLRDNPPDPWNEAGARRLFQLVGEVLRADVRVTSDGRVPPFGRDLVIAQTSVLYVRHRSVSWRRFFDAASAALAASRQAPTPRAPARPTPVAPAPAPRRAAPALERAPRAAPERPAARAAPGPAPRPSAWRPAAGRPAAGWSPAGTRAQGLGGDGTDETVVDWLLPERVSPKLAAPAADDVAAVDDHDARGARADAASDVGAHGADGAGDVAADGGRPDAAGAGDEDAASVDGADARRVARARAAGDAGTHAADDAGDVGAERTPSPAPTHAPVPAAAGIAGGPLAAVVAPELVGGGRFDDPGRLLMPLPTNAEQEEIGRRLAGQHGITVQGPPGTGKTHTIANLICHLMASGKRVLVTSHKEQPLEVLRATLPDRVRPLCVSLLGVGAGELAQLDQSVQAILRETTTIDPGRARPAIAALGEALDATDTEIEDLRAALASRAEREKARLQLDGRPRTVGEVGRWIAARGDTTALRFVADPVEPGAELPLDEDALTELYRLAAMIEPGDREAVSLQLPDPATLPSGAALVPLWAALDAASAELARLGEDRPATTIPTSLRGKGLDALAARVEAVADAFERASSPWLLRLRDELHRSDASREHWQRFGTFVTGMVAELYRLTGITGPHDIALPEGVPPRALIAQLAPVHERLAAGRGAGGGLAGRKELGALKAARVDGAGIRSGQDVELLLAAATMRQRRSELVLAWNREMAKVGGPTVDADDDYVEAAVERAWTALRDALAFETREWPDFRERLRWAGLTVAPVPSAGELERLRREVDAARGRDDYVAAARGATEARAAAQVELDRLAERLAAGRRRHGASPLWSELTAALVARDVGTWDATLAEVTRVAGLVPRIARLDELTGKLRAVAPRWAELILAERGGPAAGDAARAVDAWELKRAETWLDRMVAASDLGGIHERLDELLAIRQQQVGDLVSWSTWLELAGQVTDEQRRALNAWAQAIRRVGKGTGRHANRFRGIAREQMERCRDAVPVWIMPTWRVVETFVPEPSGPPFDVVIVDESSQCDLFSLGVLALGRQAVVVGDDRQISPTLITDLGEVHALIESHVADLPNAKLLDTTISLYDVAKWAFPGVVMLREHFRCLPELIAFSNQLMYDGEILPLREDLPDPDWEPVRAVRVPKARRVGGVNAAEALALVETVVKCCADPAYDGRSMGVISLSGEAQARHIQHLLLERLGESELAARRIKCGDAYRFQGDERDVMFLSMVAVAGDRHGAMTRLPDRQRVNVAASRARDQLWLFHSLDADELHPEDARSLLLRWCTSTARGAGPAGAPAGAPATSAGMESPLARAVARALRDRGFRVRHRVRVGHFYLDLVVEDRQGRRLAVECGGDATAGHGLARFADDGRRQVILGRLGWRFHQVRAGAWWRDPAAELAPLLARLDDLEIRPDAPADRRSHASPRVARGPAGDVPTDARAAADPDAVPGDAPGPAP